MGAEEILYEALPPERAGARTWLNVIEKVVLQVPFLG